MLELVEGFEVGVEVDGVLEEEGFVTPVDGLFVVVVVEGTLLVVVFVLGTLFEVVVLVVGTLLVVEGVVVGTLFEVVVLVVGTLLVVEGVVVGTLFEVVVLVVGTLLVVEGVAVGTLLFVVVVLGAFPVDELFFEATEPLEATMFGYFSLKLTGVVLEVNPMPPPLRPSSLPEMFGRLPRLLCPLLVAVMLSRCPI